MRKEYNEIVELANQNNCQDIFSWSKYKTFKDDKYSYFLKYIKKVPPDRFDGIYTKSGSDIHECIEEFYQGKLDHKGMLDKYEDLLFDNILAGLKYDRTDDEKNEKIGNKYEDCIRHFLLNHNKIPYDIKLEDFIGIVVDDIYFQGYIDAYHIEKRDGVNKVVITDWKSSSIYKGDKLEKEKGQLLLYVEGMHQKGVPYENIVGRWNFLKYVDVVVTQKAIDKETKQHKTKVRTLERNSYVEKLKTSITMWLKQSSEFDGDIDEMIDNCIAENSLDSLPTDVKDKFIVNDCYVEIPFTKQDIVDLKNDIVEIVSEIRDTTKSYNNTQDEMLWWQDVDDNSSYFMANLSEYSANLHKPYAKYLEEREMFLDEDNKTTSNDDDDISWLEGLLD